MDGRHSEDDSREYTEEHDQFKGDYEPVEPSDNDTIK